MSWNETLVLILTILIVAIGIHTIWMAGVTIIQVSKGYYILDNDAPQGLRLRKWFLMIITPTILVRAIMMISELIFQFSTQNYIAIWGLRSFPSFLFILAISFLGDYMWQMVEMLTVTPHSVDLSICRYGSIFVVVFLFVLEIYNWAKSMFVSSGDDWIHAQNCSILLSIACVCITLSTIYGLLSVTRSLRTSHVSNAPKILARFLLLYGCLGLLNIIIGIFRGYEALISSQEVRKVEQSSIWVLSIILVAESIGGWIIICILTNRAVFVEDWMKKTFFKSRRVGFANTNASTPTQFGGFLQLFSHIEQQEIMEMPASVNFSFGDQISLSKNISQRQVEIPTYNNYGAIDSQHLELV